MINIPVLRWGEPYESLNHDEVVHFSTGETLAKVGQANPGLLARDVRKANRAREVLREIPIAELVEKTKKAADLFLNSTLPLGDGEQSPDDFAKQQSASTGLPEHMTKFNMEKNHFVLTNMDQILDALTRGLDLNILTRGYGVEARKPDLPVSYQAQSPVLGMVLPSNSPGVHTLWLPVIPMQIGLILKPGPQEPWTPYRMTAAFTEAGIPKECMGIYPGGGEMGAEVVNRCGRVMIFGSAQTVKNYAGNAGVQVHGPGYSKILLGDDLVDKWEDYLDLMVDSIYKNSGRGCINCSGVWASRHTNEIAEAIAERIGPIEVKEPGDPEAGLAAFTVEGQGEAIWNMIEEGCQESGVTHVTAKHGERLVSMDRCSYIRPTILHCDSPDHKMSNTEYMYPFASVVECPQEQMLDKIGHTLVVSAITEDETWAAQLADATNVDRLNIGPLPTIALNWLQPHEGNLVEFLFQARAYQTTPARMGS